MGLVRRRGCGDGGTTGFPGGESDQDVLNGSGRFEVVTVSLDQKVGVPFTVVFLYCFCSSNSGKITVKRYLCL